AKFETLLQSSSRLDRCEGARGIEKLCFRLSDDSYRAELAACAEFLGRANFYLLQMLFSAAPLEQCAASWALVWIGACRLWMPPAEPDMLGRLFTLWRHSSNEDVRRMAKWALASQPLAPRADD